MTSVDTINIGDYVVIQRQKYTKLHKFASLDSMAMLGKDQVELRQIDGHPYGTTFKMSCRETAGGTGGRGRQKQRISQLEPCPKKTTESTILAMTRTSGADNRHIIDNGESQTLSAEEIEKLRDECASSTDIVSQIVENSKTFASKTEYSQEKYLKKKEKKYYEFVQIKRTNLRLITEIMFRQCSDKILGLRMDILSQILAYSGVCGFGNFLVYESGTNGLIPAALLNSIGSNTDANLIHMHPGNMPQKQALLALNLPQEQLDRCVSVNIYSVLRHFHQGSVEDNANTSVGSVCSGSGGSGTKRKIDDESAENSENQPTKIIRNADSSNGAISKPESVIDNDAKSEMIVENIEIGSDGGPMPNRASVKRQEQWQQQNEQACQLLRNQMDGLVVVAKEHPMNIVKNLLPFVKPSCPIVVFNMTPEILMEMYVELKSTGEVTNLRLTSNWMRMYQILPNRTHPDVNMSGNSGYLLCGYTVR